jgi:hypothetical protein
MILSVLDQFVVSHSPQDDSPKACRSGSSAPIARTKYVRKPFQQERCNTVPEKAPSASIASMPSEDAGTSRPLPASDGASANENKTEHARQTWGSGTPFVFLEALAVLCAPRPASPPAASKSYYSPRAVGADDAASAAAACSGEIASAWAWIGSESPAAGSRRAAATYTWRERVFLA